MNRYSKALKHIKSKELDEKIRELEEVTNNTQNLYGRNPDGWSYGEPDPAKTFYPDQDGDWPSGVPGESNKASYVRAPGYWSGTVDWDETEVPNLSQDEIGSDGKNTSGLIADDGTVKTLLPEDTRDFILGPLVDGFVLNHTTDAYCNIGYIQKDTRQFVLLGRVEGVWFEGAHSDAANIPVWDGGADDFTSYNDDFTLAHAQWFRTQVLADSYVKRVPYFYSGGVPQQNLDSDECPDCPAGMKGGFVPGAGGGGDSAKDNKGGGGWGSGNASDVSVGTDRGAAQSGDAGDLNLWGLTFDKVKDIAQAASRDWDSLWSSVDKELDKIAKSKGALGAKKTVDWYKDFLLDNRENKEGSTRTNAKNISGLIKGGEKTIEKWYQDQKKYITSDNPVLAANLEYGLQNAIATDSNLNNILGNLDIPRGDGVEVDKENGVVRIKKAYDFDGLQDFVGGDLATKIPAFAYALKKGIPFHRGGIIGETQPAYMEVVVDMNTGKVIKDNKWTPQKQQQLADLPRVNEINKEKIDIIKRMEDAHEKGDTAGEFEKLFQQYLELNKEKEEIEDAGPAPPYRIRMRDIKPPERGHPLDNKSTSPTMNYMPPLRSQKKDGGTKVASSYRDYDKLQKIKKQYGLDKPPTPGGNYPKQGGDKWQPGQNVKLAKKPTTKKKNRNLVASYEPEGKVISESRKIEILREIKKPYKMPEIPKQKYKFNFSGKYSPQNTPDKTASKETDALVASGNDRGHRWRRHDTYWQGYETTERMNIVYDKLGHSEQAWDMVTKKNSWKDRNIREHLNILAHERQMLKENPNYESPFYESNEPQSYEKDPLYKRVKNTLNKELHYKDRPSVKGYPNEPPPEMVNGWHPKFGKRYKYDKLDPQSAEAMPKQGDPEIDANIEKATDQKAKARKAKILAGKTEQFSNWRDELTDA